MASVEYDDLLEHHLGIAYHAHVVGHEPEGPSIDRLASALNADADLKRAAARKLKALPDSVRNKCFVSKTQYNLLTAALAKG